MNINKIKLRQIKFFPLFFLFSTLLALQWGCEKKKTCPYGQKKVGEECRCKFNSNCPKDQVCKNGKCVVKVKKDTCPEVPCTQGKVCKNSKCVNCENDQECGDGKHCSDGLCKKNGNECSPDKDCPLGQKCEHGYCVEHKGVGPTCTGANCIKAPCNLKPVFFNYNEASIPTFSQQALKHNIACLKKAYAKDIKKIHLIGMCDPRGPTTFNDDLASLRIKSVIDRMTLQAPSLMKKFETSTEPLGETCAKGTGPSGWRKDRRVQIVWYRSDKVCPVIKE
ncbi:MAG: hypothetical protein PF689_12705 [Deltaproteobacteria bacterium]|jgi:hypothetical protein|nr:hypothetical protein [Deltaproteobacteria bacterium]